MRMRLSLRELPDAVDQLLSGSRCQAPHPAAPLAATASMPTCTRQPYATADTDGCICTLDDHLLSEMQPSGLPTAAAQAGLVVPGGNVSPATLAAVQGTSSGITFWNTFLGACGSTPFSWHRASPAIPLGTVTASQKPGAQRSAVRWTCAGYDAD
jgi:hypothetical protein